MESVILDEVRKLTKVLGFQSNTQSNNNLRGKSSLSLHQKITEHSNSTKDSFSENQEPLGHTKIENTNMSLKAASVENECTQSKKDRYSN